MRLPTRTGVDERLASLLDEFAPGEITARRRAEDLVASALCMYGAALRRARALAEDLDAHDVAERWASREPLAGLLALHRADSPAPPVTDPDDVRRAGEAIDRILEELADAPAEVRERSVAMLQAVTDLHEAGLAQLTAAIDADLAPPPDLLEALGRDHLVASILMVHGLHPEPVDLRLERALDELRRQSGEVASVELVDIADSGTLLRVRGRAPADAYRFRLHIERTLTERIPDLPPISFDGGDEPGPSTSVTIPVESVTVRSARTSDADVTR